MPRSNPGARNIRPSARHSTACSNGGISQTARRTSSIPAASGSHAIAERMSPPPGRTSSPTTETRCVFASYEFNLMHSAGVETSAWQRSRLGVAPYCANYDDLSTWLMVQVDHHPTKDRSVVVTPLVRLFYHTTLAEFGVSDDKTVLFNIYQQF